MTAHTAQRPRLRGLMAAIAAVGMAATVLAATPAHADPAADQALAQALQDATATGFRYEFYGQDQVFNGTRTVAVDATGKSRLQASQQGTLIVRFYTTSATDQVVIAGGSGTAAGSYGAILANGVAGVNKLRVHFPAGMSANLNGPAMTGAWHTAVYSVNATPGGTTARTVTSVEASGYPAPARNFLAVGHLSIILGRLVAGARHSAARGTTAARIRTSGLRAHDPRIERVMDHLAGSPDAKPDMKALQALTHMSESTLRRSFKDHTGTTIGDYLRNLRMATAAKRLLLTDLSVGEIASQLGFPDANYFTRVFKAVFGVAPAHYRRQAREE